MSEVRRGEQSSECDHANDLFGHFGQVRNVGVGVGQNVDANAGAGHCRPTQAALGTATEVGNTLISKKVHLAHARVSTLYLRNSHSRIAPLPLVLPVRDFLGIFEAGGNNAKKSLHDRSKRRWDQKTHATTNLLHDSKTTRVARAMSTPPTVICGRRPRNAEITYGGE